MFYSIKVIRYNETADSFDISIAIDRDDSIDTTVDATVLAIMLREHDDPDAFVSRTFKIEV